MNQKIIKELRQVLKNNADKATLEISGRFFKEGEKAKVYGIKMAEVRKIGKEFYKQIKHYSKQEIFAICEELWKSSYLEEAVIACMLSEGQHKKYEPTDFIFFQHLVKSYVNNWADCDTLCNHTIETFITMYPAYINDIKKWTKSPNRWMKRAAAVTFIIPARRGMFLKDVFDIADKLITDKDDLVQKGYGWMLKAAGESNPKEVFDYVMSKKIIMPRTAFRYAIEKLPAELKMRAMKK